MVNDEFIESYGAEVRLLHQECCEHSRPKVIPLLVGARPLFEECRHDY